MLGGAPPAGRAEPAGQIGVFSSLWTWRARADWSPGGKSRPVWPSRTISASPGDVGGDHRLAGRHCFERRVDAAGLPAGDEDRIGSVQDWCQVGADAEQVGPVSEGGTADKLVDSFPVGPVANQRQVNVRSHETQNVKRPNRVTMALVPLERADADQQLVAGRQRQGRSGFDWLR